MADTDYLRLSDRGLLLLILDKLDLLNAKETVMSAELDALTAQVTQNTSAEASAIQLLNNLHDLLINAAGDPTAMSALVTTLKTSSDALAAAIVANTPATSAASPQPQSPAPTPTPSP